MSSCPRCFLRDGGRRPFRQRYRQRHGRIGVVQAPIRREVLDQGELHRVTLRSVTVPGRGSATLAADPEPEEETMSEANKELVRRHVEEIWNRQDLVAMLQLGVVQPPGPPPS